MVPAYFYSEKVFGLKLLECLNSDISIHESSPFNAKSGEGVLASHQVRLIGVMRCIFIRLTCCCSSDLKPLSLSTLSLASFSPLPIEPR